MFPERGRDHELIEVDLECAPLSGPARADAPSPTASGPPPVQDGRCRGWRRILFPKTRKKSRLEIDPNFAVFGNVIPTAVDLARNVSTNARPQPLPSRRHGLNAHATHELSVSASFCILRPGQVCSTRARISILTRALTPTRFVDTRACSSSCSRT